MAEPIGQVVGYVYILEKITMEGGQFVLYSHVENMLPLIFSFKLLFYSHSLDVSKSSSGYITFSL